MTAVKPSAGDNTAKLYGLYVITDQRLIAERKFKLAIESALQGGARIIQYRDKSNDLKKRQQQASLLCTLCEQYQAVSIINDDIELAVAVGANGVHIGQHDVSLSHARERLGAKAIIGVSCYNDLSLAQQAEKNSASYVAFGAMFPSQTKPTAVVAGLDIIAKARVKLSLPICCIGGISNKNIQQVFDTGADMAAVVNAVFSARNIKDSATVLSQHFR